MSIKVGSDFSGVGAFEQSLNRLGIKHEVVFACDKDKYARLTYVHNYGEPKYYPTDVYDREIPGESLDLYVTSPPCQSFSLAGKRLGKDDKRGILFFNSHEFIVKNNPRYFIFENVKGLLSDDGGKTFSEWLHLLGGKSVNGMPIVFPYDGAVPYHVYWKVLNAKDFGVPQNRERVFIIGIRDDVDNDFSFPKEVPLTKRLKDVLESEVDEKYYLSDKMIAGLINHTNNSKEKGSGFAFNPKTKEDVGNCITSRVFKMGVDDNYIQETPTLKQVGSLYENNSDAGRIYDEDGISCTIKSEGGGLGAKTGLYEVADVITHNMMPRSGDPKKGGTGHLSWTDGIAYCLDTGNTNAVEILGLPTEQMLEINENGTSNALTTVQKDNVVVYDLTNDFGEKTREYTEYAPTLRSERSGLATKQLTKQQLEKLENLQVDENVAGCITHAIGRAGSSDEYIASVKRNAMITQRIRKLTPRECFRLMDFPDTFDFSVVSNSQAYKQAGNSIVVAVLTAIINKLKL